MRIIERIVMAPQYYHEQQCTKCGTVPKETSVCLLCGTIVCLKQRCCIEKDCCEAVRVSQTHDTCNEQFVNTTCHYPNRNSTR